MKKVLIITILSSLVVLHSYCQTTDSEKYSVAYKYYQAKEYSKSIPILNELVAVGHADALNLLGICYNYGYGVEVDLNKAYEYYLEGAEKDNCYAQRNLAWLFRNEKFHELHSSGEGNTYRRDFDFDKQTEKWLRKAAQKNADYMYELGWFYLDMTPSDEWQHIDADLYLKKAADAGSAIAKACLGNNYLYDKRYDEAFKLLQYAKGKGITTFWPFIYGAEEKTSVDACLMVLQYLRKNPELRLEYYRKYNEDGFLLTVNKGEGNVALIELSKTGAEKAKTPFFYSIGLYEGSENSLPSIYFSTSSESGSGVSVSYINKNIQFDIVNCIYKFSQQNKDIKVYDADYNGGEYIYIKTCNDNGQYRYIKINKAGKVIKTSPFIRDRFSTSYNEDTKKIEIIYDRNLYFINSTLNLDVIFTVLDFLINAGCRLDYGDVLYVNNSFLLLHAQRRNEKSNYEWAGWYKLSPTGTVMGKTTSKTDHELSYDCQNNVFYSFEQNTKISIQEMLERMK